MKRPAPTLNQKLAALALLLGAVALFSEPHRGPFVKLDTRELASIVEQTSDHVTPSELGAWIIEGRSDYRLLDLRSQDEFAEYHIPTAENVPISALPDYPLLPNEKVVLYSEGGIHAAQAWFLLRAQGRKPVYTVLGGLDAWKDEVLFPVMPASADAQQRARFERTASVARFFGGQPRAENAAPDTAGESPGFPAMAKPAANELPALAPPVPGRASPVTKPKKRKEGC